MILFFLLFNKQAYQRDFLLYCLLSFSVKKGPETFRGCFDPIRKQRYFHVKLLAIVESRVNLLLPAKYTILVFFSKFNICLIM
jgi:hypothetical protein